MEQSMDNLTSDSLVKSDDPSVKLPDAVDKIEVIAPPNDDPVVVETNHSEMANGTTNTRTDDITNVNATEVIPDIKGLTIKNLDTGEEFIIGENDPDFEFNTFEIRGSYEMRGTTADKDDDGTVATEGAMSPLSPNTQEQVKGAWWSSLLNYLYGSKNSKQKTDAQDKVEQELQRAQALANKPKTPFTKLSSFKFRKELGRGAFGRVLLAEAKTDGKLYALKIISKKNMRSSDKRQAKAERDILHSMTLKSPHPFTSGLKFAFQSENNLYLGMDYIPGGNLRELIKKFKCLPETWVQMYAAQLVLAISHLHSLNVLYRDIKPHNVMIDARGHLVLIDFGLSKQEISHPRGALSLVGTPDYSAPEVLKTGVQQIEANNREKASSRKKKIPKSREQSKLPLIGYGKAADWWSLGIMIYEMLSGTPTFRGADLRQTYQKILYADLEFVPEDRFSPAARNLLMGLIKRDPSLRLGAWENPPQDIMSSPFFAGIEWDAIYERRQDGPWIPEVQVFGGAGQSVKAGKSSKSERKSSVANNANNGGNGGAAVAESDNDNANGDKDEYAGFDTFRPTIHPSAANRNSTDGSGGKLRRAQSADKTSPVYQHNDGVDNAGDHKNNDNNDDDDSSSSEDDNDDNDDGDEYLSSGGMRDSVFILSRGQLENKLADWSFMDEQVLRSTMDAAASAAAATAAGEGDEEAQERRRRKEERRAARKLRNTIATVPEEGGSELTSVGTAATAGDVTPQQQEQQQEQQEKQQQQQEPEVEMTRVEQVSAGAATDKADDTPLPPAHEHSSSATAEQNTPPPVPDVTEA